jgi:tungstate transport system ATP-binding protein
MFYSAGSLMISLLTLRNILFQRGNFSLKVDHLDICAGKVYHLKGANGAGKSTLLHLLAQLILPESGEISFGSILVCGDRDRQRLRQQITLVEQSPFLFDSTVFDNLAFGLRLRDVQGDLQYRRIQLALQKVGLEGFESRQAKALSGGEIRRVALARALVLQPKVLLLDETMAGLDRDALMSFETTLDDLASQDVAVVIASHDAWHTEKLVTEALHLSKGLLVNSAASARTGETDQCQSA